MPIVLDASIAAVWALADEEAALAGQALEMVRKVGAVTPTLFFFEIRNILVVSERRGRITRQASDVFLDLLRRLPIAVDTSPDEARLLELARRHRLTVYDAAYLELSLRERLDLVTLDARLEDARRAEAGAAGRG